MPKLKGQASSSLNQLINKYHSAFILTLLFYLFHSPSVPISPHCASRGEGTAPYYVSIIPGGQPSAAALEAFPQQSGTSYTW